MKKTLGSLIAVLALTSTAWAQWTTGLVSPPTPPGYITGGVDTAVVAVAGPEWCMGMSLNDIWGPYGRNVDVWCKKVTAPVARVNQLPVAGFSTVAVNGKYWAGSDVDGGPPTTWYGSIGGTPEQASSVASPSLSLSHYSDGSPVLVHGGLPPNNHVYMTSKSGLTWTTTQLTNNFTSPEFNYKTIAARVFGDTLHITYWDESWSAVRYARKAPGQSWIFETVFTFNDAAEIDPIYDLWPSLVVNSENRPFIVFPMYGGTIRVFERSATGTWTQETLTDTAGAAVVYRTVAVEMHSDRLFLLYVTYNAASNTSDIRYRKKIANAWSAPESVAPASGFDVWFGLSMDIEDGASLSTGPHIGFVYEPALGLVYHGQRSSP